MVGFIAYLLGLRPGEMQADSVYQLLEGKLLIAWASIRRVLVCWTSVTSLTKDRTLWLCKCHKAPFQRHFVWDISYN